VEAQFRNITSTNTGLQDNVQRLQTQAGERGETIKVLQSQIDGLENQRQLLEKRRSELEARLLRTKDTSDKAISKLKTEQAQAATNATNTISTLQNELSISTATIRDLRSSLDSTSHSNSGLTKTLEERTVEIHHLLENVTDLQGTNKSLEQKLENLVSQMKSAEKTAAEERGELCKKHTADIDAERRTSRNLRSSLDSLRLEMDAINNKVTELTCEKNALHERVGKLGEQYKSGEQQIAVLRTELANGNGLVKDLEKKGEVAREEARKEKTALNNQVNKLRQQLEDARKESGQHRVQIQRLETAKNDLTSKFKRAQTTASEKDGVIQEVQQKNSALKESKENLEVRLVDIKRMLDEARDEKKEAEDKMTGLVCQIDVLRGEMTTRDETLRGVQVQVCDLSSTNSGLRNTIQRLETQAGETEKTVKELQSQNNDLEKQTQLLEKGKGELETRLLRTKGASDKAILKLKAEHSQAATNTRNTISTLQNELSVSSATILELRSSLDSASHDNTGLTKGLEERTVQTQHLLEQVTNLQGTNKSLEQRVKNLVSQMKSAEETASKERGELCKKHASDIDAERRISRELQSSLKSLQLDMGMMENKVTELTCEKNTLHERVGKLGEQCKSGEQQITVLRTELANGNGLVKDLEEKGEVAREERRKEKKMLSNQVNELRRQLGNAQKESGQRQVQIQRLETNKDDLANQFRHAQTSVSEKDVAIQELQQENSALEESKENLEKRLADTERTLDEARDEARETEEKVIGLECQIEILRAEITTRDDTLRGMEMQVHNLTSTNAGLKDAIQRLETQAGENVKTIEGLQLQNEGFVNQRQLLEKCRRELEGRILHTMDASEKAISKLKAEHAQAATNARNTISTLQNELSVSSATILELRSSLDSTSHDNTGLTKTLDERTVQIEHLIQRETKLQDTSKALEQRLANLVSQMESAEETATIERGELSKKHTTDIDAERSIAQNLQSSLKTLQLQMDATKSKIMEVTCEKKDLHEQVGKLEERCKSGEQQIEALGTELAKGNTLVKDLEKKGEEAREEARKEKTMLSNQVNELRRQLEGAQKESGQRQEQIQHLEAIKDDLTSQRQRAQTSVNEKEAAIQELQQKNSALEESRENLEMRLVDMERTLDEARHTARNVTDRANKAQEREITRARSRIQELQDKLSTFSTTTKQLHASLDASNSDVRKAQQVAEEQAQKINCLQQQVVGLQDAVRSLEVKNHETISQMTLKDQAAREEKAAILRGHAAEMQTQRTTMQALQGELEHNLKEMEDKLGILVVANETLRTEITAMKEQSLKDEAEIKATKIEAREAEGKATGLKRQVEVLQRKFTTKDEALRGVEVQVRNLTSTNAGLQDTVQRLQTQAGERDKTIEELRSQNDGLENQRQLLEKCRRELEGKFL
jgi:chromosome segregation ATPase